MARYFSLVRLAWAMVAALLALAPVLAQAANPPTTDFESGAPFAILIDYDSGTVIYQKNADTPMEPASMAKLMTLAVVFDQIKTGRIHLDDQFIISEHAWRDGGAKSGSSTMFAKLNSKVPVEDLLYGLIVQSGNDAAIALAEGIAGSEGTFANMENQMAAKLGLTNSHFTNASGLPDPDLHTTPRDLANLARYLIRTYPEYYHIFSEKEFTWNGIKQPNRNSLLGMGVGVDGLKTGHSDESGYGEVLSTTDGGRRLIAVINGLKTMAQRTEEGRKLLNWGARSFEEVSAFPKGKIVGYASVYGGAESSVGLVGADDIDLFLPKGKDNCPQASITYKGPLRPPVQQGDKVAQLQVTCAGQLIQTVPLFAASTVEDGDLMNKATAALRQLALGWL
ncbi:MAG TPA: D-alanyl-D-alanine carboxypeptidase family protein [Devosiaceae bacterium]|nr:D-alanyl-D-alanine carboxypeptidase family protein [Devosiaceae bacterium]